MDLHGDGGENQGQGVGEIVAGVGDEGQAMGTESRDHFHHNESEGQSDGPLENAAGTGMGVVMVVMRMAVMVVGVAVHAVR